MQYYNKKRKRKRERRKKKKGKGKKEQRRKNKKRNRPKKAEEKARKVPKQKKQPKCERSVTLEVSESSPPLTTEVETLMSNIIAEDTVTHTAEHNAIQAAAIPEPQDPDYECCECFATLRMILH